MRTCTKCGADVPDGVAQCPVCGSPTVMEGSQGVSKDARAGVSAGAPMVPETPETSGASVTVGTPVAPASKKKKRPVVIIVLVIAALLVLGLFSQCTRSCMGAMGTSHSSAEDWPRGTLAQMLPSLDIKCEFVSESDDSLYVDVSQGMDREAYDAYVSACKERGFAVDANEDSDSYEAWNGDGYRLSLTFWDLGSNAAMHINLDAPKAADDLVWPDYGLATLVPNPNKAKGSIAVDSASQLTVYVGDVTEEEFDSYVKECMAAGFDVDHSKSDMSYSADDAAGHSLHVVYEGFKVMSISLYAPDDNDVKNGASEDDSTQEESSEIGQAQGSGDAAEGERTEEAAKKSENAGKSKSGETDFKALMDGYEAFMDGYIAFMMDYQEGGQSASMLTDYLEMLAEYEEWAEKMDDIDEDALTSDELAYAAEVQARVAQKLTDAAVEVDG